MNFLAYYVMTVCTRLAKAAAGAALRSPGGFLEYATGSFVHRYAVDALLKMRYPKEWPRHDIADVKRQGCSCRRQILPFIS